jgi:4-hydroxybenzoate polyprenyltransferase
MLIALLKTMRPRQWTKNALIAAPLFFDGQITNLVFLERVIAAFFIFCFLSSAIYIFNDISDIEADKKHPQKKNRPIASGRLPVSVAWIVSIGLIVILLPLSYLLSPNFAIIALIDVVLNIAYSKWFKHIPLLDVIILASFYVLRVGAGVSVIQVKLFSPWLYVVTTLLALYLGLGKRRAELALLAEDANSHRRVLQGYSLPLLDQLITIVSSSTIVSYSLYTFLSPIAIGNHSLMLTIPFVIYGIFRYLYLIQIKHAGGAPEEILLMDHPLQISIGLWVLSIFVVFYLIH